MKKIIPLFIIILLFACKNESNEKITIANIVKQNYSFNEGKNLISQIFKINKNKDYTLVSKNGVCFNVPKGSISSDKEEIALEIREAINLKEIISANLSTTSNHSLLSSGGMVYINPVNDTSAKILKTIQVSIPTNKLNTSMKIYKGEKDVAGKLNWVNPVSIMQTEAVKKLSNGTKLFQNKCASCHSVNENLTGNALWNIQDRRPFEYIKLFTQNSAALIQGVNISSKISDKDFIKYSSYANCLYDNYNNTAMPAYPDISDKELQDILIYIKAESINDSLHQSLFGKVTNCDSCELYASIIYDLDLENQKEIKKQDSLYNAFNRVKITGQVLVAATQQEQAKIDFTNQKNNINLDVLPGVPKTRFDDNIAYSNYYQFNIETFGWYNVDLLLKESIGNTQTYFAIQINNKHIINNRVQLIIPSLNVLATAGKLNEKYLFGDVKDNGKIYLPIGAKAYIIAMGEDSASNFMFGNKEIIIKENMVYDLAIMQSTTTSANDIINNFGINNLNSKIQETKNAKAINKNNQEQNQILQELKSTANIFKTIQNKYDSAELIRPKTCNCGHHGDIGHEEPTPVSPSIK